MQTTVKEAEVQDAPAASQAVEQNVLLTLLERFESFKETLDGVVDKMQDLEERQGEAERARPRFVPMERPAPPRDPREILASLKKGEEADGVRGQVPVGTNGLKIDDIVARTFPQEYEPGDQVRINPDVTRPGNDRLWGDVLAEAAQRNHVADVGVVKKVCYLSKTGDWKYKVRFDGLTRRQGDGFFGSELEPA